MRVMMKMKIKMNEVSVLGTSIFEPIASDTC